VTCREQTDKHTEMINTQTEMTNMLRKISLNENFGYQNCVACLRYTC